MANKDSRIPIAIMIGKGSKLPAILQASNPSAKFTIKLVVSHKSFSPGVELALKNKIAAIYFKLPDYRNKIFKGEKNARADYMKRLAWFITQREYAPQLLVFAGWDLVMDKNFFSFFKADFGNGYAAINLHPALIPTDNKDSEITLPDGTKSPVIKGEQEQVLETVVAKNLSYFGPTVHFMVPTKYDTGKVVKREFIKISRDDTVESLRKKLMPAEDRILVESINEVISKNL